MNSIYKSIFNQESPFNYEKRNLELSEYEDLKQSVILKNKFIKESVEVENPTRFDYSSDSGSLPSLSKASIRSVESFYGENGGKKNIGTPSPSFTPESFEELDERKLQKNYDDPRNELIKRLINPRTNIDNVLQKSFINKSNFNNSRKLNEIDNFQKIKKYSYSQNSHSDGDNYSLHSSLNRSLRLETPLNIADNGLGITHNNQTNNQSDSSFNANEYKGAPLISTTDDKLPNLKGDSNFNNHLQNSSISSNVSKVQLEGMMTNVVTRDNSPSIKSHVPVSRAGNASNSASGISESNVFFQKEASENDGYERNKDVSDNIENNLKSNTQKSSVKITLQDSTGMNEDLNGCGDNYDSSNPSSRGFCL
ncbi:hypothetical protein AYI70_g7680 [Smittium culicis]|uniref:Uncharacterized protein n=1 Tax=Smittium culicis TaxID=133412 RepID=A0A1R1X0Z7_9FUNG|nr:hypothetical protein AYI70_g11618 [Smittium culicis]OMJ14779.1 hypothetical protein AYI70_g7680 [Smittium culicis]